MEMATQQYVWCLQHAGTVSVYTDLPGLHASDSPQAIVPLATLLVTSFHPDIVLHNESGNLVALLELTRPLDLVENLKSARA